MFPLVAFLILAVLVIVVIVAVIVGGIGSITKGPDPSEGDRTTG